jgi:1-acyl-sn-glycerol-3-phosphate acyltransferase
VTPGLRSPVVATTRPSNRQSTRPATRKRAAPPVERSLLPVPVERAADLEPELDDPRRSDVDEWGRSETFRQFVRTVYGPMYDHWHRVELEGLENVPTEGGALLVANHAGAIPADAPAIIHGIETQLGRPVYGLAEYVFRTLPIVGTLWSRAGGVVANPHNAYRLLREQQQLALVFPEGTKATSKSYSERYKLRRFGRGGFVEIAMRAGVPIVPIAVVGSEESMPVLFNIKFLAKALNVPYVPVTANMALLGPLGFIPFPAKMRIRILEPVHLDVPPDQPRYSRSRVMDHAEEVRERIQNALYDMLRARRSVWFG